MSTCVGAPAPHVDCLHGNACDWGRTPPSVPVHELRDPACQQRAREAFFATVPPIALGAVCSLCRGGSS